MPVARLGSQLRMLRSKPLHQHQRLELLHLLQQQMVLLLGTSQPRRSHRPNDPLLVVSQRHFSLVIRA